MKIKDVDRLKRITLDSLVVYDKQITANTFIASDPIKKREIKLILFNLNIVLYIVINGLFSVKFI